MNNCVRRSLSSLCEVAPKLGRRSTATGGVKFNALRTSQSASSSLRSAPALALSSRRWHSTESDDAFKPKRKTVPDGQEAVHKMLDQQIKDNKVMLYMKGTPQAPQCGFSMQVVRILHMQGVDFSSVNVLDHPAIREGIKSYSDWPTIPQVFVNGEFIGGCDVLTQMNESGDLTTVLKEAGVKK